MNPTQDTPASSGTVPTSDDGFGTDDLVRWLRRFVICNPFYLASAAVLLFGLGQINHDARFVTTETRQLLFQFGALQAYGCLVICTALWLVRRRVWYDSALLVVVENGLVLAPFLVISQAVLIDASLAVYLAAGGALAVIGRGWSVRRFYTRFQMPDRAWLIGLLVLAVNVGLPLVYRTRVDTDWHAGNRVLWLGVLPFLAVLPNVLLRTRRWDGIAPEQSWLPLMMQGLWIAGTAVHAWSVAWIDKTPTPPWMLVPLAMATCWTLEWRHRDFGPGTYIGLRATVMVLACAAPFWPTPETPVLMLLAGINAALFLVRAACAAPDSRRLSVSYGIAASISVLRLIGAIPGIESILGNEPAWNLGAILGGAAILAMVFRTRNPVMGLLGAFAAAIGTGFVVRWEQPHVSIQFGALLGLVHSFRWSSDKRADVLVGRGVVAGVAMVDALAWAWDPSRTAAWTPGAVGLILLVAILVARRAIGLPAWGIAFALYEVAVTPAVWTVVNTPTGFLALGASLTLFAVGTALATRRHAPESAGEGGAKPILTASAR